MSIQPKDPSAFEASFALKPLTGEGERLDRAEALIGLFISAAMGDNRVSLAELWTGSFAPYQSTLPLPSRQAVDDALDAYRTDEFRDKRREIEEYNVTSGLNPDGSNIQ